MFYVPATASRDRRLRWKQVKDLRGTATVNEERPFNPQGG